jgi:transposase
MTDAEWICDLVAHGLVRPSFVPPAPIRRLRDLTRRRTILLAERTREKQLVEKLLEDAGVKLSVVATEIFGKSGRAILDALIAGERRTGPRRAGPGPPTQEDPRAHRGAGRAFRRPPRLPGQHDLRPHRHDQRVVTTLDARIDTGDRALPPGGGTAGLHPRRRHPHRRGHPRRDRHRHEPLHHRRPPRILGRRLPRQQQDRRQEQTARTRPGDRWLKAALGTAAMGAIRTKNSYAHALFRRVAVRRGGKRAQAAVAHSLLVAAWHFLTTNTNYHDLGDDYFITRDNPEHRRRRDCSNSTASSTASPSNPWWLDRGQDQSFSSQLGTSSAADRNRFHMSRPPFTPQTCPVM